MFIDLSMYTDFVDMATTSWEEAVRLIQGLAGVSLQIPLAAELVSFGVKTAVEQYMTILSQLIGKNAFNTFKDPIFGEFITGGRVQFGDVRGILSALGGGSPDVTVPLMGGITSGQTMLDWLGQNGIDTPEMIWIYGYGDVNRRIFNGHLQMDGLVFSKWDDDGLIVAPQDAWLRSDFYRPADHYGCACIVAPYIPNFGNEFNIDLSTVDS
jgi:hypothetical protein